MAQRHEGKQYDNRGKAHHHLGGFVFVRMRPLKGFETDGTGKSVRGRMVLLVSQTHAKIAASNQPARQRMELN